MHAPSAQRRQLDVLSHGGAGSRAGRGLRAAEERPDGPPEVLAGDAVEEEVDGEVELEEQVRHRLDEHQQHFGAGRRLRYRLRREAGVRCGRC